MSTSFQRFDSTRGSGLVVSHKHSDINLLPRTVFKLHLSKLPTRTCIFSGKGEIQSPPFCLISLFSESLHFLCVRFQTVRRIRSHGSEFLPHSRRTFTSGLENSETHSDLKESHKTSCPHCPGWNQYVRIHLYFQRLP